MTESHVPVLLKQVLHYLNVKDDGVYLDCTFGAGGYSKAILEADNTHVCAMDRDSNVMEHAEKLMVRFGDRFSINFGEFANITEIVQYLPFQSFDGIVFDVGVSSMQIDCASRGFSFLKDGPLDMRMDQNQDIDAAFIVNNYSEEELARVIRDFGDERKYKAIARAIVYARSIQPIYNTLKLAKIVKSAVGHYNDSIHAATRTFQALRIVVNDELEQLKRGLEDAITLLRIGGVLAVVTFHSGEDAIVKNAFNSLIKKTVKRNKYSIFSKQKVEHQDENFELVFKKTVAPDEEELAQNIRSRSAKLRAIRRIR